MTQRAPCRRHAPARVELAYGDLGGHRGEQLRGGGGIRPAHRLEARIGDGGEALVIPDARLIVFAGGHVPHTTDPAGVAAELVSFCEHHLDSMAHGQGQEAQGGAG